MDGRFRHRCLEWGLAKPRRSCQPVTPYQANSPLHPFGVNKWVLTCNWTSATSVTGVAIWWMLTKERHAWCNLQVKLFYPCLSALWVWYTKMALYKYSSFPFLFLANRIIGQTGFDISCHDWVLSHQSRPVCGMSSCTTGLSVRGNTNCECGICHNTIRHRLNEYPIRRFLVRLQGRFRPTAEPDAL